jgi:hypothetical protein
LAERDERGRPQLARARWPVQVRSAGGDPREAATFMVSYLDREEKGTDVNHHWWRRIERADYRASQLPKRVGTLCRPDAW